MNAGTSITVAVVGLGAALGLTGCVGSEPAAYVPPMPTITPAPLGGSRPAAVTPAERMVRAVEQARAGQSAEAVAGLSAERAAEIRVRTAQEVAAQVAAEDPVRAEAFARAWPPGAAQQAALEGLARVRVRSDGEAAVAWALGLEAAGLGATVRRFVAEELVAAGPRAAVERLAGRTAEPRRDELMGFAVAAWARREPDAAVGWVRDLPVGERRNRWLASAGFELAQTQPERAVAVVEMLPEGRDRWLLTGALAQTWVGKDPQAAHAWARQMAPGAARTAALAGFETGIGIPSRRPSQGAPGGRGGSLRTRGGAAAVTAWREGDGPNFERWLAGQPAGLSRDEAILEYVRQRAASEPGAIGQWLTNLPPGATRDQATELYVEGLLAGSPREAAKFLRALPRAEQTPELLERTARRLMATDPGEAERWIRESRLPEYRKEELLRQLGR